MIWVELVIVIFQKVYLLFQFSFILHKIRKDLEFYVVVTTMVFYIMEASAIVLIFVGWLFPTSCMLSFLGVQVFSFSLWMVSIFVDICMFFIKPDGENIAFIETPIKEKCHLFERNGEENAPCIYLRYIAIVAMAILIFWISFMSFKSDRIQCHWNESNEQNYVKFTPLWMDFLSANAMLILFIVIQFTSFTIVVMKTVLSAHEGSLVLSNEAKGYMDILCLQCLGLWRTPVLFYRFKQLLLVSWIGAFCVGLFAVEIFSTFLVLVIFGYNPFLRLLSWFSLQKEAPPLQQRPPF